MKHVRKVARYWHFAVIGILAMALVFALTRPAIPGLPQWQCTVGNGTRVEMDVVFGIADENGISVADTTVEDVAAKAGIYSPFREYRPVTITVGNSTYLRSFEENIMGMKKGEEKTFVIPPEKAFGYYNSSRRMIVAINLLNRQPRIGETVRVGNLTGRITSMNSTAVLIDFNSPLAGKSLVYRVWIRDVKCG